MALYSTLQRFITKEGAPVEGASVNVKLSGGAVDAELFATRTGVYKSNPFLTTENGEALCYVKAGRYDMTVTKGVDQIVFKGVEVGPVSNVGTFSEGGTITDPDQLVGDADGNKWRWTGNLNYTYAAGENPESTAEWVKYIGGKYASIIALLEQWGYNYKGTFAKGFAYSQEKDAGIDENGKAWVYVGAGAPNKAVAAGTVPSAGAGYEQVAFNAASGVSNENGGSVQDFIDSSIMVFNSVSDLESGVLNGGVNTSVPVGAKVLTGRTEWVRISDTGGSISDYKATTTIYYSDFPITVDDNSVDNFREIKKIHDAANLANVDVVADMGGKSINIGLLPDDLGVEIKTNCDWGGCKFRLSESTSGDTLYSRKRLFSCLSETIATLSNSDVDLSEFVSGSDSLPSIDNLGYQNVVIAIYGRDKILERNGDPSQPIYAQELCAVFENGKLTSPLQFTYTDLLRIEVYNFETERLELKNLQFTLENNFKSAVGLHLQRNNTDLAGVSVSELDNQYKDYSRNFINLFNNYNSVISFVLGNGFETGGGTYLIRPELTEACEIIGMKAINGWGVFGGNFNKNIKYKDCDVNRIDQHALGQDCVIERCNIYDNAGVAVTGKGKLTISNCNYYVKANGLNLVTLRSDYGSIWDGEIHINDIKVVLSLENQSQAEVKINIIEASILNVDFGTDHIFPSVFADGIAIDTDASTTRVICYNIPVNTGVNDQYLPRLAKFHNIITTTENVRVIAAPNVMADQPKYKGEGMFFDIENIPTDYGYVHSSNFDVTQNRRDAILSFVGSNYSGGTPFPFSASISKCDNCAFVWTLPSPLRVSKCNGISGMLTKAGNGSGLNFEGASNAVFVSDSSCDLMNYRGSQEFMMESVNLNSVNFKAPAYNSEVGSYRSITLNKVSSAKGCLIANSCPVITADESLIDGFFTGFKSSNWRS